MAYHWQAAPKRLQRVKRLRQALYSELSTQTSQSDMRHAYTHRNQFKAAISTIDIATSNVRKLPEETIKKISESLEQSVSDLTVPESSVRAWADLKMACLVARRIERIGVVRGLAPVWDSASEVLESIVARNMHSAVWHHSELSAKEVSALKELAEMHIFQLRQLSRAEFERAVAAAQREAASHPRQGVSR